MKPVRRKYLLLFPCPTKMQCHCCIAGPLGQEHHRQPTHLRTMITLVRFNKACRNQYSSRYHSECSSSMDRIRVIQLRQYHPVHRQIKCLLLPPPFTSGHSTQVSFSSSLTNPARLSMTPRLVKFSSITLTTTLLVPCSS